MSIPYEATEPPRPRWLEWCERNSRPKNHDFPRPHRELTRWQKRGPMTRHDWIRFYNWAVTNAMPRELIDQLHSLPESSETADKSSGKRAKNPKVSKKSLDKLLIRIVKLCKPRFPRDKYEYPPPPIYTYSPKIHWNRPARHDRGRPFEPPRVPRWFYHIENEIEFWSSIRFPLRRSALRYVPSQNIIRMAQPRILPPEIMHCPVPEKPIDVIPPRRRMTAHQWLGHLRRLEYLAKPVIRPYYNYYSD